MHKPRRSNMPQRRSSLQLMPFKGRLGAAASLVQQTNTLRSVGLPVVSPAWLLAACRRVRAATPSMTAAIYQDYVV